jgi:hypothetical protein
MTASPLTWADLVAEEPRLAALAREPRAHKRKPDAARQAWACRLYDLVGWGARNPRLRSEEAWLVASRYLHDLPT